MDAFHTDLAGRVAALEAEVAALKAQLSERAPSPPRVIAEPVEAPAEPVEAPAITPEAKEPALDLAGATAPDAAAFAGAPPDAAPSDATTKAASLPGGDPDAAASATEEGWLDHAWADRDWAGAGGLGRLGIGLILLGLILLFKYAIDEGWLIPEIRVGFGVLLGAGLLFTGFRLSADREGFTQLLLGGGLAAWYATLFAAFQLYGLIAYPIAFVGMVLVTLLAFGLALFEEAPVLSVIGMLGGLGTPFLLYRDEGNLLALMAYLSLLVASGTGLYVLRQWRALLWSTFLGVWAVLVVTWFTLIFEASPEAPALVQLGVGVIAVMLIASTLLRRKATALAETRLPYLFDPAYAIGLLTPFLVLAFSDILWGEDMPWAAVAALLSTGYLAGAVWLEKQDWGRLKEVYIITAMLLAVITWVDLLEGGWVYAVLSLQAGLLYVYAERHGRYVLRSGLPVFFTLAAMLLAIALERSLDGAYLRGALALEAAALHTLAHRRADALPRLLGHTLLGLTVWALLVDYQDAAQHAFPLVHPWALADLGVVLLALWSASTIRLLAVRVVYQLGAHGLVLVWLWHELVGLPEGQAYVSVAWGVYALGLLIYGLRRDDYPVRLVALATIVFTIGKLLLVDLGRVDPLLRILLFFGFGGVFMLLSYFVPMLWQRNTKP